MLHLEIHRHLVDEDLLPAGLDRDLDVVGRVGEVFLKIAGSSLLLEAISLQALCAAMAYDAVARGSNTAQTMLDRAIAIAPQ
ncbi:MAG: hypothetical protein KTR15_15635 [Phycisphaeraceae bacterium]|nr:hypothetical protein [Phycisphaeraceae bacterium]